MVTLLVEMKKVKKVGKENKIWKESDGNKKGETLNQ